MADICFSRAGVTPAFSAFEGVGESLSMSMAAEIFRGTRLLYLFSMSREKTVGQEIKEKRKGGEIEEVGRGGCFRGYTMQERCKGKIERMKKV